MSNFAGKFMVLIHLFISMVALTWAACVYLQFIDWGWKVPRKELDYVVASEYDKRAAYLRGAYESRDRHYHLVRPSLDSLRDAEDAFVQNNLWYDKELARLTSSPVPIKVHIIKYEGGVLQLDPADKRTGKPAYQKDPLPDIAKSLHSYTKDLQKVHKDIRLVEKKIAEFDPKRKKVLIGGWEFKQKQISIKLAGLDPAGERKIKPGLDDLLKTETDLQAQIRAEIDYVKPLEQRFRNQAEEYRARREILENDLEEMNKRLKRK